MHKHRDKEPREHSARMLARQFLPHMIRQRKLLIVAYACSLTGVLLLLTLPWPLKFMIDDVLRGEAQIGFLQQFSLVGQVIFLAVTMATLAMLTAIVLATDKILHARIRERFGYRLREELIQQIHRLSRFSRQAERSGELTMRLVSDSQQVSRLFCKTAPTAIKHVFTALFTLGSIFLINQILGLTALLMAGVLASLVIYFGPRLSRAAKKKRKLEGQVAALTQEMICGIEHVQSMGLESNARQAYLAKAAASLESGVDEVRVAVKLERTSQSLAGIGLASVAGVGGVMVLNESMTLGTLTVCIAYITQLFKPIEKINEIATSVSRGLVRARRIMDVFSSEVAFEKCGDGVPIDDLGCIECVNVSYIYPQQSVKTIDNFSYCFRKGECTAIVGESGSGKSTLLRLILRLQHPSSGVIFADSVPYGRIDPTSLRSQFAVLMQNAHLFSGTFRSVLTELDATADEGKIRNALLDVRLLELIESFPNGLDSSIDEFGDRVSGGQKARLLLSRALIANRPVLILDEPFANIDAKSKQIILDGLQRIKNERILIVVTHEHELLKVADQIVGADQWMPAENSILTTEDDGYARANG